MRICFCWRALARQQPILYNSEKKVESVGCKIGDMRSRLCFFISRHRGMLVNARENIDRSISSNSPTQLGMKYTINQVKYGCF